MLLATLTVCLVGPAAIYFGGPKPVVALGSVNEPFKNLDYSALPVISRFQARDGEMLAYRHYAATAAPGAPSDSPQRRVVLIHGSSASSRSLHPLAQALSAAGFTVDALDVRGHGDSGTRERKGRIAYIGQLEDDLADFTKAVAHQGPSTLVGFSAGGGFALRFSASAHAGLFDRYILLAPFLVQAPSNRPGGGGWASVGLPRIIALTVLNRIGITRWNDLPTVQFALNAQAAQILTPAYSYALMANFGAHLNYAQDIARAPAALKLLVGANDELMLADRYAEVFAAAGKQIALTLVPGAGHIGLTLDPAAMKAIVTAAKP